MDQSPLLRLFLFIGYPGSGKTTAAKIIERATGAVHIWADQERVAMFSDPTHSLNESTALYDRLNQQTATLLNSDESVIFDTNFNFYKDRQRLRDIAKQYGAETITIWITTPKELAKKRAVKTHDLRNGYQREMNEQQFDRIAAKLEPPRKDEKIIKIDGINIDRAKLLRLIGS